MDIKYSVRELDNNNMVSKSIFETFHFPEALEKVEECQARQECEIKTSTKYIIVTYTTKPPNSVQPPNTLKL